MHKKLTAAAAHEASHGTVRYGADYFKYLTSAPRWRQLIRLFYFLSICRWLPEPTIDIGCGAGGLLSLLPTNSFGLEVNASAVEYCRGRGLDVRQFTPDDDIGKVLRREATAHVRSICCMHVLEHIEAPMPYFLSILDAAADLDIEVIVFVVPGEKGYQSDPTHRTFLDLEFLSEGVD